ncbi:MAG: DMT family transporter [Rhizorhabdus sp.]|uniref:DMT family transporter n=1 Tax=Rhizorhabdus sp. TaxID=1968843 RepID=UPI001B6ACC81|nr:DMT family transporter [Rhizorhabdus sp.]MBP8231124.1 DMT family transporter [Rhizorhabdus sp.]
MTAEPAQLPHPGQKAFRDPIPYAGALVAMVLFAGNYIAGRHAAGLGFSPADLVALRYGIAAVATLPLLLRHGSVAQLGGIGWRRGLALVVFAGAPYTAIGFAGLALAPAGHGAVLNPGAMMVAGVVLSAVFLGEPLRAPVLAGMAAVLAGLVLVAGGGIAHGDPAVRIGDLLLAGSGLQYAIFMILVRRWKIGALQGTAAINLLSALIWLPPYLATTGMSLFDRLPLVDILLQAGLQGIVIGVLAGILYVHAVGSLGPARAAFFPASLPVLGTVLAALLLGEPMTLLQAGGALAVCAGMIVALKPARRREPAISRRA